MKKWFTISLCALLISGCASSRTQILQPKKIGFSNYPVIEVVDFDNNIGGEVPFGMVQELPNSLAKELTALNLFKVVNRIPLENMAAPAEKTLVLKGNIIEFNPGSRGKRYWGGMLGWGKGFMTIQLTALDKKSREEIFKGNVGSELSGGFFGGSFEGAVEKLQEEMVKCIQINY